MPQSEQLLALYRQLLIIRYTEEQLARSHQMGLVHGACHTYVGEEAIAAGVCAHLRPDDAVFSTHRGHGHALAKGVSPHEVIAELFGRATGCSQGRGGSMHLFKPEVGMMGTSGIVGPCILQATGAGYSFKLLKTDQIGVAFFGDGAVNNGAFHEGLNLASIWKLPTLFMCARIICMLPRCPSPIPPAIPTWATADLPTAWRALQWTATTCWPSTKRRRRQCNGRAAAKVPP